MSKLLTSNQSKNSKSGKQRSHSAAKPKTAETREERRISSSAGKKLPPIGNLSNRPSPNAGGECPESPVTTQDVLKVCQESDCLKVLTVDLHGYKLTKICDLTKLTRIKSLDLSGNFVSKIEGLDANQLLKQLKLYDNKISAIENLECLSELQELQLQYNLISSIGSGLTALRNLTSLRLDNNKLKRISPQELSPLAKNLKVLDISGNELTDVSAVVVLGLLTDLNISGNIIKSLPSLKNLEKLTDFNCSENELSTIAGLEDNKSLVSLDLSRNRLNDGAFAQIHAPFVNVDSLNAEHNQLSNVDDIGKAFPNLTILNLCKNEIHDAARIGRQAMLLHLTELDLRDNPAVVNVAEMCEAFPSLEMIDGRRVRGANAYVPLDVTNIHPIGARIEQQMREFDTAMSFEYEDMICRFKSLRKTMDASFPCPANEDGPSRTKEDRPLSKCRGRLEDAKKFSETNYTD